MQTNSSSLRADKLGSHVVQLHGSDDQILTSNAVGYLAEGLKRGGGAIIVATAVHIESFARELLRLGVDTESALQSGRLAYADADTTLARFIVGGHPDSERFDRVVGTAVREVKKASGDKGLRAYGEMVGLLWRAKQYPAAIRLEQLWNKLRDEISFELFCAYPIDVLDKDFDASVVDALLCAHTHLLPSTADASLQSALNRAIDEVRGSKESLRDSRINRKQKKDWAALPELESTILWLRANHPDQAEEILTKARSYYQASA